MVGHFRFLLAFFVLIAHCEIDLLSFAKLDISKISVAIFFILAGRTTYKVLTVVYKSSFWTFIKDRLIRIYPSYFLCLIASFSFFILTKYGDFRFSILKSFLTFLIIPTNYFHFIDLQQIYAIKDRAYSFVLAPFWSLGLELQAYLLISILVVLKKEKILKILSLISFLIFLMSAVGIFGKDNSFLFTYVLLLGNFYVFYIGILICKKAYKEIAFYFFIALLLLIFIYCFSLNYYWSKEVLTGVLFGIVVILVDKKKNIKLKNKNLFGNMSYHLYVWHFLFVFISYYLFGFANLSFVLFFSVFTSYVLAKKMDTHINNIRNYKK